MFLQQCKLLVSQYHGFNGFNLRFFPAGLGNVRMVFFPRVTIFFFAGLSQPIMEFWYFKRSLFSWGKKKLWRQLWRTWHFEFIQGKWMAQRALYYHYHWDECTEPSVSYQTITVMKRAIKLQKVMQTRSASEFLFHFLCRLFPSGLKAREPPLYGTRTCENCRLWTGPRNPIKTSIHRLCIYQMVSTLFLKRI